MAQPRDRIPDRRQRSRVQPLDVVDGEAEGALGSEQPQRAEEGGSHRTWISAERRVAEQQCGLQGLSLDRRQLGQDVADHLAEHVCQRQE